MSARFNLIIPNKPHIMHLVPNTTISQRITNGDNWAKSVLPAMLSTSQYQSGNTAIIITWDEGNANNFYVPLIIITPSTQTGGVSSVSYNHYSVLKGLQQMVGYASPLLGHAGDAGVNSIRDDGAAGPRRVAAPHDRLPREPSWPRIRPTTPGLSRAGLTWSDPITFAPSATCGRQGGVSVQALHS
jgi:hypothetical protein